MSDSTPPADVTVEPPPLPPSPRRPWFPWYLYALVAIAAVLGFARSEGEVDATTAFRLGYGFGSGLLVWALMVFAYRLSKLVWVAALVGFLMLALAAPRQAEIGRWQEDVGREVSRRMAAMAMSLDDFNGAGGIGFATSSAPPPVLDRLQLARGLHEGFGDLVEWFDGGPGVRDFLRRKRNLSPREVDRVLAAFGRERGNAPMRQLIEAQRDSFAAAESLLAVLHEQAGNWQVDAEGVVVFGEDVADAIVERAQQLFADIEAADVRRRDALAKLAAR